VRGSVGREHAQKNQSRAIQRVKTMTAKNIKAPEANASTVASKTNELFGFLAGEFKIIGDIESPVFSVGGWKETKKQ